MPRGTYIIYKPVDLLTRGLSTSSYGEEVETYTVSGSATCHIQPYDTSGPNWATTLNLYGGLEDSKIISTGFFKPAISLIPNTNRIRDDTQDYHVREVRVWPDHTEVLLEGVVEP